MKSLVLAMIVFLPLTIYGQTLDTNRASVLADDAQSVRSVSSELMEMIRQDEKDPEVIRSVGNRFVAAYGRSIASLTNYKNARTRFGLQSEMDDLSTMILSFDEGYQSVFKLTGTASPVPYTPQEISYAEESFENEIVPMAKELVDMRLGTQGAADFLTDPGLDTATNIVAAKIIVDVRKSINSEIRRITGARIRFSHSLKDHILAGAREAVSRKVGNIFLKFAVNHFVVEILAVKVLEWIGPRLREFLRPKGNLEGRLDRATSGMRARSRNLNSMRSNSDLSRVWRVVEAAENHIKANNFLRGDISKAGRDNLSGLLAFEESTLMQAVALTKVRFMIESQMAQQSFGDIIAKLEKDKKAVIKALDELADNTLSTAALIFDGRFRSGRGATKVDYPGIYRIEISAIGDRFKVRAIAPNGTVMLNNELSQAYEYKSSSGQIRSRGYETKDAVWLDGSRALARLSIDRFNFDGSPMHGRLTWLRLEPDGTARWVFLSLEIILKE